MLAALRSAELDVLVVGGGITGAGIARDAALRGLATALVEAVDFAAGTSSRSSKLIHGGVRYLAQGDVGLVREAAAERLVLKRIAPHLAVPVTMVIPTYARTTHLKLGAGLWAFEKLVTVDEADRHRLLDRREALAFEPTLAPERLFGAAVYGEYLTDDARLVLENVRDAHLAGALCANHAEVTALERGAAVVRDTLDGSELRVRARVIVNAAGPWVSEVERRAGVRGGLRLQLTKGVHLVVARERLPLRHVVVMAARDKRSVFAVPRDDVVYLGTTDTVYDAAVLNPGVTRDDVAYLLDAANRVFTGPPLTEGDLIGSWAGLRPLLHQEGKAPSEISRRDETRIDEALALISIAGGKLTAYRTMAERVVDLVCTRLGRPALACRTAELPLPSARGTLPTPADLASVLPGLPAVAAERLRRLYGAEALHVVRRAAALGGVDALWRAEIERAVEAEMALTLEDALERRLRLLLFDAGQGLAVAEEAAALMAQRLGWNRERTARELADYRQLAACARTFT
ncbi:MAG TPA: glycerol-3-phosphate dehydrogenase/oxidase [Candidatus Limnocylindria bacterium]|nr:glycerol-3-phosphate dehydrogenase/oxidase [Candidatus Limnocylindria bacterium]